METSCPIRRITGDWKIITPMNTAQNPSNSLILLTYPKIYKRFLEGGCLRDVWMLFVLINILYILEILLSVNQ